MDDLISKVIEDEIEQLMNKSHADQIAFFEKSFNISIRDEYPRWHLFIEIFERRNLAAHGSLKINDRYIVNCKASGYKDCPTEIGQELEVDCDYLESAIDLLIEFGVLLAFSAWQKQVPKDIEESFGAIVEVGYDLLVEGHPCVAAKIIEYAVKVKGKGASDAVAKRLIVNLAIAYKMQNEDELIDPTLDATDWSAASPVFKLCRAAIREDVDEVLELLPVTKAAGEITALEVREWPAFTWVRRDGRFNSKFEEVFGEPLGLSRIATPPGDTAPDAAETSEAD